MEERSASEPSVTLGVREGAAEGRLLMTVRDKPPGLVGLDAIAAFEGNWPAPEA